MPLLERVLMCFQPNVFVRDVRRLHFFVADSGHETPPVAHSTYDARRSGRPSRSVVECGPCFWRSTQAGVAHQESCFAPNADTSSVRALCFANEFEIPPPLEARVDDAGLRLTPACTSERARR
jgi:hypothetical protein